MEYGKVEFKEGVYTGEIENGMANGYGVLKFNNGDVYLGEMKNNCMTGIGLKHTYDYKTIGSFVNGKRHGKCVTIHKRNNYWFKAGYLGSYSNDVRCGYGVSLEGSDVYEGNFSNDLPNGKGLLSYSAPYSHGYLVYGNFTNGKLSSTITNYPKTQIDDNRIFYGGYMPENNYYHGHGELISNYGKKRQIGMHNEGRGLVYNFKGITVRNNDSDWNSIGFVDREINKYLRIYEDGGMYIGDVSGGERDGQGIYNHPGYGYNSVGELFIGSFRDNIEGRGIRVSTGYYLLTKGTMRADGKVSDGMKLTYDGELTVSKVVYGNKKNHFVPTDVEQKQNIDFPTYQGTLNCSNGYSSSVSCQDKNEYRESANTNTSINTNQNSYDGYVEEYVYTGPYADLVIDDLPPINSMDSDSSVKPLSQKPSLTTTQKHVEPTPTVPPQPKHDYGDEYTENLTFFDRIKIEREHRKELKAQKNQPEPKPERKTSTPAERKMKKVDQSLWIVEESGYRDVYLKGIKEMAEALDVSDGVTAFWGTSFFNDDNRKIIREMIFPSSLDYIEANSFENCVNLQMVDLSKSKITDIKEETFKNCKSLKTVILPKSLNQIDKEAFSGCESLEAIYGDNVQTIGDKVFKGCTALESVGFPSLKTSGAYAFSGCASLESVYFPRLKTVSIAMFMGCTSLKNADCYDATIIGGSAFSGCTTLEDVKIYSVERIYARAFENCSSITHFYMPKLKGLYDEALKNCIGLKEMYLPKLADLGIGTFNGAKNLKTIHLREKVRIKKSLLPNGVEILYDIDEKGNKIEKVVPPTIEEEIAKDKPYTSKEIKPIGASAIPGWVKPYVRIGLKRYKRDEITSITLPKRIKTLKRGMFQYCTNLTEIDLSKTKITCISAYCFSDCVNLKKIILPDTVNEIIIDDFAFSNCESLEEFPWDKITVIGIKAFSCCLRLKEIDTGDKVVGVCREAFSGCISLEKANINMRYNIGDKMFSDCVNLKEVNIPNIEKVCEYAFRGCTSLKTVRIPNCWMENINKTAFYGCTSDVQVYVNSRLDSYVIPDIREYEREKSK